jgi:16S rRNA (adenine1518-N6/adenine1519-N6)-dimethyltransferase
MKPSRPRKRFGQHFLNDRAVIARIIETFQPQSGDTVVEIGPGRGALTRDLIRLSREVHAIELDRELAGWMAEEFANDPRLRLHAADALSFQFCGLRPVQGRLRFIGNLPYNISTPLLFHLLDQLECIGDMLFMLQKELVDRMAAGAGNRDYGRLSVMIQWRCRVEKLFDVEPGAFSPPPKVQSSLVKLVPHPRPPVEVTDPRVFARIVRAAFAQRRKTLRNSLSEILTAEELGRLGIDPRRRAETLSLDDFARLSTWAAGAR